MLRCEDASCRAIEGGTQLEAAAATAGDRMLCCCGLRTEDTPCVEIEFSIVGSQIEIDNKCRS